MEKVTGTCFSLVVLSATLILAQCFTNQETHHFLGKQRCYSSILVHRCSALNDHLMQAKRETFSDANLSPPHTNALCCASALWKSSGTPYHWLCSQLACHSNVHRLILQAYNGTLSVPFFLIIIISSPDLLSPLQLWFWVQTEPTKDHQRTNLFHMSQWPPAVNPNHRALGKYVWLRIANGFPKFSLRRCSELCLTVPPPERNQKWSWDQNDTTV